MPDALGPPRLIPIARCASADSLTNAMSEFGDELFRRIQRINSGVEPDTKHGRRCARCQKDMSDYLLLLEPTPTDVCNECEVEVRKEGYVAQWKAAKAPVYDIDEILSAPGRKAW